MKWISVKDRLPDEKEYVIIHVDGYNTTGFYTLHDNKGFAGGWYTYEDLGNVYPDFWRPILDSDCPLPEAPQ